MRPAVEADLPNLLPLMRELAEFERYAGDFAITEETLREQGFSRSPPDFYCIVAEENRRWLDFLFITLFRSPPGRSRTQLLRNCMLSMGTAEKVLVPH